VAELHLVDTEYFGRQQFSILAESLVHLLVVPTDQAQIEADLDLEMVVAGMELKLQLLRVLVRAAGASEVLLEPVLAVEVLVEGGEVDYLVAGEQGGLVRDGGGAGGDEGRKGPKKGDEGQEEGPHGTPVDAK
jgi:hypothetical protein